MKQTKLSQLVFIPHPSTLIPPFGAQGRTQTFILWFVGPALHQLSYSGSKSTVASPMSKVLSPVFDLGLWTKWRSELESNQPLGFFKPTLIRLSYPTEIWFQVPSFKFPGRKQLETLNLKLGTPYARLCRSRCTFSITSRSSCASMKRYLRHSARASA